MTYEFIKDLDKLRLYEHIAKQEPTNNTYIDIATEKELLAKLSSATYIHVLTKIKPLGSKYENGKYIETTYTLDVYRTNIGKGYRPYLSIEELVSNNHKLDKVLFKYITEYGNTMLYSGIKSLPVELYTSTDTYILVVDQEPCMLVIGKPVRPNELYFNFNLNGIVCKPWQAKTVEGVYRVQLVYPKKENNKDGLQDYIE